MKNTQGGTVYKYLVADGGGNVIHKVRTIKEARAYAGKSWFIYKLQ